MKSLLTRYFIVVIGCLAIYMAPGFAQAQTQQGELSPTQAWVQGIEDHSRGYSSWIQGIQPPGEAEAPDEQTGIDATINAVTAPIASLVGTIVFFKISVFGAQLPLVVLWLVIGAVFFTLYMGFINIRGFKHAIELVRGDYADPSSSGRFLTFKHWQQQSRERSVLVILAG